MLQRITLTFELHGTNMTTSFITVETLNLSSLSTDKKIPVTLSLYNQVLSSWVENEYSFVLNIKY